MIRRTRRQREIPFSFDSFLDVVANVVGIIIKLILIVWVGGRSYSAIEHLVKTHPKAIEIAKAAVPSVEPRDPLEDELERQRRELEKLQERLLAQLRQIDLAKKEETAAAAKVHDLEAAESLLDDEESRLRKQNDDQLRDGKGLSLTFEQLAQRRRKLLDAIRDFEKTAPPTQVIHYRTPVSKPVNSEEFLFECRNGRVTFLDIASLLQEVKSVLSDKEAQLRTEWQVVDETPAVGAFRLRYKIERTRGGLAAIANTGPDRNDNFSYGLTEWIVEPVYTRRGEDAAAALAVGSDFRQIVDRLDAEHATVTFCVYPDSFGLYRQLRDYLYQRDLVVAGRPLAADRPIIFSRFGSRSRGQ